MTTTRPDVSVVLVTVDDVRSIRRTLRHLRAQTIASSIELLVAAPSEAALGMRDDDVEGSAASRLSR